MSAIKANLPRKSVYDFSITDVNGKDVPLENFRSKALLIVNVSVKDTDALAQLKLLHVVKGIFGHRGLRILAFPCGQFDKESATLGEFTALLEDNHMTIGEVFAPIDVVGSRTPKLFQFLKSESSKSLHQSSIITSNFTVFIVNDEGQVVRRLMMPNEVDSFKDVIDSVLSANDQRLVNVSVTKPASWM